MFIFCLFCFLKVFFGFLEKCRGNIRKKQLNPCVSKNPPTHPKRGPSGYYVYIYIYICICVCAMAKTPHVAYAHGSLNRNCCNIAKQRVESKASKAESTWEHGRGKHGLVPKQGRLWQQIPSGWPRHAHGLLTLVVEVEVRLTRRKDWLAPGQMGVSLC